MRESLSQTLPARLKIGWAFGLASIGAYVAALAALFFNLPEMGKNATIALVVLQFMGMLAVPESIAFFYSLFTRKDK